MSRPVDLAPVLWALRETVGDHMAFDAPFETVVRPDDDRVTVTTLFDCTRVTGPDELTLRSLHRLWDGDPLFWDHAGDTAARVVETVRFRHTVTEVLGPARLLAADEAPMTVDEPSYYTDDAALFRDLLARASPGEVDEAGLRDLDVILSLADEADGPLRAVAGWHEWPGSIAHLGVYVAETERNRGLGLRVAGLATEAALANGLLPLWRARTDNRASLRVAESLGYWDIGHQLTIKLSGPSAAPR